MKRVTKKEVAVKNDGTMKLSQVLEVFASLRILGDAKLPAKAGYRVAKAMNKLRSEQTAFEEQRNKLAATLGKLSDDGMSYSFEGDNAKEFKTQLDILLAEEVKVDLPTVTPDDIGNVELQPNVLAVLDGIVIVEAAGD